MKPISYLILAAIMAGIIFAADLYIPPGVAFAVSYIIVILLTLQTPYRNAVIIAAVITTALVILGHIFSTEGDEVWKSYVNISIAVFAIWLIVLQGLINKEFNNELNDKNKTLKMISLTDALTGINNRRFFDAFIESEWKRAIRNKTFITVVMIDIDFFKLYNDNYGHLEGDKTLKKVAKKLKSVVYRPGDQIARYGGEEFALILTDTKKAKLVADRCREAIMNLKIPHKYSKIADVITISVGFCTVNPKKRDTSNLVIDAADKALYKAKEGGRNRVEQITLDS